MERAPQGMMTFPESPHKNRRGEAKMIGVRTFIGSLLFGLVFVNSAGASDAMMPAQVTALRSEVASRGTAEL